MTDQYKCQSYIDSEGTLQNCTCGRCGEGGKPNAVDDLLEEYEVWLYQKVKELQPEKLGHIPNSLKRRNKAKRQLFDLIASKVIGSDSSYQEGQPETDVENRLKAEQREKLKKIFGVEL